MERQIKETDIYCQLRNIPYDAVYQRIKNVFGNDTIFTKRKKLLGILIWEFEGKNWHKLYDADPVMYKVVCDELDRQKQFFAEKCTDDLKPLSDYILNVPDDSCIYYRPSENGGVQIKMAAWGYIFQLNPPPPPKPPLQDVTLLITYADKPCAGKNFHILAPDDNYYPLTTDANGRKNISYTKGGTIRLKINGNEYLVTLEDDKKEYAIDTTLKTKVRVKVLTDGLPKCGVKVSANRNEHFTDSNGVAEFDVPLPQNGELFSVTVNDQTQNESLKYGENAFLFEFKSVKKATVSVMVFLDGIPEEGVTVFTSLQTDYQTDSNGKVEFEVDWPEDYKPFEITVKGQRKSKVLIEGVNEYEFDFEKTVSPPPVFANVNVNVLSDGKPVAGEKVYAGGNEYETDVNGICMFEVPIQVDFPFYVVVRNEKQSKQLHDGENKFEFSFKTISPPLPRGNGLKMFLMFLALMLLIAGTYYACYQILN